MSYSQIHLAVRVGSSIGGTLKILVASLDGGDISLNGETAVTPTVFGTGRTTADTAGNTFVGYTHVFTVTGLAAGSTYNYTVSQGSNDVTGSVVITKTTGNRSIAVGSCDNAIDTHALSTPYGMYGYIKHLAQGGGNYPLSDFILVDDVTYADQYEIDDSAYSGRAAEGIPTITQTEYDYGMGYFGMLGLLGDPGIDEDNQYQRRGHSPDRQWVFQNITSYLMWGDHEFRNNIGFKSTVASISDGAWNPGKGAWDGTYNGIMPPKMNTAANHAEAQNWMLDLGNTLIITPDAITKGGGTGDGALFGSTQISEILAAVNNAKWDFVVLMMSNGIRYMSTSAQNDSTTYLANSTLADEKPTEYAQLFTNTGGIQDLSNTLGFKFVLIHGDHHNPSVINHQNTDGTVNEQFTSFTAGSINGSQNFVTDASVLTDSTYRGSTVVWQDESRKEANKPTQGPTHRASIARVDILTETFPKKLVVTLVDDGWDEVYVGEYQAGQTGNLAGARTADVIGQPPTLTQSYNDVVARVGDTFDSFDFTTNFTGIGDISFSSTLFPSGIQGYDLSDVSGTFEEVGTTVVWITATNEIGSTNTSVRFTVKPSDKKNVLTKNTSFLSPIEFKLILNRLPNVEFFVKSANVPGINSGSTERTTPFKSIYEPGDKLVYEEFTVSVICDEDMVAFREVSDWLVALTYPDNFTQYASLNPSSVGRGGAPINKQGDGIKSDGSLVILNSNVNANVKIRFSDIFPISVGSIQLDTSGTDLTPPVFDITFRYDKYDIEV